MFLKKTWRLIFGDCVKICVPTDAYLVTRLLIYLLFTNDEHMWDIAETSLRSLNRCADGLLYSDDQERHIHTAASGCGKTHTYC